MLQVMPTGESRIVEVEDEEIPSLLGAGFDMELDEGAETAFLIHEMWKVAELDVNLHASMELEMGVGGPVLIYPTDNSEDPEWIFSTDYRRMILERNSDDQERKRLSAYVRKSQSRGKFVFNDPDRWIYNGRAFKAIVLGATDPAPVEVDDAEFSVWIFGAGPDDPFTMKVREYTLYEVMTMMISGDLDTAAGDPPEYLLPAARKFGLI